MTFGYFSFWSLRENTMFCLSIWGRKKRLGKKPQSHWDLNQISINYASYGLHKTFRGAWGGQDLSGCWLVKPVKAAVEMEDMTVAGDLLATAWCCKRFCLLLWKKGTLTDSPKRLLDLMCEATGFNRRKSGCKMWPRQFLRRLRDNACECSDIGTEGSPVRLVLLSALKGTSRKDV